MNKLSEHIINYYTEATEAFEHFHMKMPLADLEKEGLDFETFKIDLESHGLKTELAKDIKTKYWQNNWKKKPCCAIFRTNEDL